MHGPTSVPGEELDLSTNGALTINSEAFTRRFFGHGFKKISFLFIE